MRNVVTRICILSLLFALSACSSGGRAVPPAAPAGNPGGSAAQSNYLAPATQKQYAIPFGAYDIGAAPDGKIWWGVGQTADLLNPADGNVAQYNALAPTEPSSEDIFYFAVGKDGSLWYTLPPGINCSGNYSFLNDLQENGGTPVVYSSPTTTCYYLHWVAIGSDGNVWVGGNDQSGNGAMLKFVPGNTSGPAAIYPVPFTPGPMTLGPDGSLWFIALGPNGAEGFLGRIDTAGNFTQMANVANAKFLNIASGGGYLWVNGSINGGYAISRFTTGGVRTDYAVSHPLDRFGSGIAANNGFVYFAEPATNAPVMGGAVGQLNIVTGAILEYSPVGCLSFNPFGMTIDSSANVWISDPTNDALWELTFPQ